MIDESVISVLCRNLIRVAYEEEEKFVREWHSMQLRNNNNQTNLNLNLNSSLSLLSSVKEQQNGAKGEEKKKQHEDSTAALSLFCDEEDKAVVAVVASSQSKESKTEMETDNLRKLSMLSTGAQKEATTKMEVTVDVYNGEMKSRRGNNSGSLSHEDRNEENDDGVEATTAATVTSVIPSVKGYDHSLKVSLDNAILHQFKEFLRKHVLRLYGGGSSNNKLPS